MRHLPHRADKVLTKIENDDFMVKVDMDWMVGFQSHLRRTILILAVSLVAAALLIFMALTGKDLGLGLLSQSAAVIVVLIMWAVAVLIIHKRN